VDTSDADAVDTSDADAVDTSDADAVDTPGSDAAGTAAVGTAVDAGAGTGDFPSFVPSGATAATPAVGGERVSAATKKDGIDTNRRRNPAAAKTFLTTHPSKKPPRI